MTTNYYDIIIIGSGMAGLFSAYNIQKINKNNFYMVNHNIKICVTYSTFHL